MKAKNSVLNEGDFLKALQRATEHKRGEYLACYSSWLGGYLTDPAFMVLPLDDHMVHRGDGVFEALRMENYKLLAWAEHWQRLQRSAASIGLKLLWSEEDLITHLRKLVELCGRSEGFIRIFVSRGPGSFSVNPYEVSGPELHIVVTALKQPPSELYKRGLKLGPSRWPQKPEPFFKIKSCNYLPNVLMKKEAVDLGLDLTLSFTEDGRLAEGPTENVALVTKEGDFLTPQLDSVLEGTTLAKVMELAGQLVSQGSLKSVQFCDLRAQDLKRASEVLVIGTTWGVIGATSWEGEALGGGRPGPIAETLQQRLKDLQGDLRHTLDLRCS